MKSCIPIITYTCLSLIAVTTNRAADQLDDVLRGHLARAGVGRLDPGPVPPTTQVRLGQLLFFDKVLSGNRDISCATCHHPSLVTGDALSLSIGTKGIGLGPTRELAPGHPFIPRNATELFNRASPEWKSMFWDSRVEQAPRGTLITPAGELLPLSLTTVLEAQAMFPVTSRDEMRGSAGDVDVFGQPNELALFDDKDLPAIWRALTDRLLSIGEYRDLFADAYPDTPPEQLGFEHAAAAMAAYENSAFTFLDSPWDQYVAGDEDAVSASAKRGAVVFFSTGNCWKCHSGSLLTDQKHYNIGVPQLGPGKAPDNPLDLGRARETKRKQDMFAFRTPPLRNVAVTGPWMHNGAYTSLERAVRHHLNPVHALLHYDVRQLDDRLQESVLMDAETLTELLATLDPNMRRPTELSDRQIAELLDFLDSLTSPSLGLMELAIPPSVPSGLPVDGVSP